MDATTQEVNMLTKAWKMVRALAGVILLALLPAVSRAIPSRTNQP